MFLKELRFLIVPDRYSPIVFGNSVSLHRFITLSDFANQFCMFDSFDYLHLSES